MLLSSPKQMLSKPSAEVIATTSHSSKKVSTPSSTPPPPPPPKKMFANILSKSTSPLRTKGDIMGYSNDKSSEDDSSDSEESITSKSGDDNENVNLDGAEFILPDTIEGIQDRFNELYMGFVGKGKHEDRNDLEFLLDELLRQGATTLPNTRS